MLLHSLKWRRESVESLRTCEACNKSTKNHCMVWFNSKQIRIHINFVFISTENIFFLLSLKRFLGVSKAGNPVVYTDFKHASQRDISGLNHFIGIDFFFHFFLSIYFSFFKKIIILVTIERCVQIIEKLNLASYKVCVLVHFEGKS